MGGLTKASGTVARIRLHRHGWHGSDTPFGEAHRIQRVGVWAGKHGRIVYLGDSASCALWFNSPMSNELVHTMSMVPQVCERVSFLA
jgi:hypothetical protein